MRSKLVPITNFCSTASYFLIVIGMILSFNEVLINMGIILFLGVVIFQLVTLPVEFDASARALRTLEGDSVLESSEVASAKKVLTAAALTYVAALLTSLIQLARLIAISRRSN